MHRAPRPSRLRFPMQWGLGLAFALGSGGCPEKAQTPTAPAAAETDAAKAAPRTSVPTPWIKTRPATGVPLYEAPAQVMAAPSAMAEIMPTFRAQVVAVLVRPGQRVTPGMPVLTVLMPEVLRAAGSYQGAALRIAAYQQRREQLLSLKSEGLLRVADLSESEARLAEAKATQLEALATLQAASLSPGEAAGLSSGGGRVFLRSPVAGVVTSVQASLGQVTDGGTALVKIAGSGEVRIEARLLFGLPAHARYELILPSGARRLLTLSDRSPQLDSRDGTVQAWLIVAQPTAAPTGPTGPTDPAVMSDLPPGLVGKLQVYVDEADATLAQAVLVPARALLLKNSRAHVLRRLAKGDHELLPVQVLLTTGADALVKATTGKLSIGDEVATDASLYAGDGASETAGEP